MVQVSHNIACDLEPTGRARLALSGSVTAAEAVRLHRVALDLSGRGCDVVVCCNAVEYLDAAIVQVILALGRELTRQGRRCEVTGVAGVLADLFKVVGLG